MSARPSLFVCAAVLACLLAPPALAKPVSASGSAREAAPTTPPAVKAKIAADRGATAAKTTTPAGTSSDPAVAGAISSKGPAGSTMAKKSGDLPAAAKEHAPKNMSKKTVKPRARPSSAQEQPDALASAPAKAAPMTGCGAALTAGPTLQFERTRSTLREFSWSDMARFFETSLDEAEPEPIQVGQANTIPADEAIRRSGLPAKALEGLARARAVDLLTERELARVAKVLTGATPAAISWLLRADAPALRAHVWTWLATTPAGVCALAKLDGREVEAAIRDRSVAVEHGEDLVFRPLGDYALAARARLAVTDPQSFDGLLRALWVDTGVDPRVRALVAGLRVRRGHADSIELGLRDPTAAVRGATAAAAIDRDRERYEERVLDHAADDPADLVTELIVGELLGGPDGVPRGPLAARRDPRVATALARWRGRGDPLAPLPAPEQPLRFAAPKFEAGPAPAPATMIASTPPAPVTAPAIAAAAPTPVIVPEPPPAAPATEEAPIDARPLAQAQAPAPARREADVHAGPRLPSVLDDPTESALRP